MVSGASGCDAVAVLGRAGVVGILRCVPSVSESSNKAATCVRLLTGRLNGLARLRVMSRGRGRPVGVGGDAVRCVDPSMLGKVGGR